MKWFLKNQSISIPLKGIYMRYVTIFFVLILIFIKSIHCQNSPIIISPNGNEILNVGSSKLIEWKGVLPSDTVTIEYSIDRCSSWMLITEKGTGLKYNWQNIPNTISDNCLLRIRRYKDFEVGIDNNNSLLFKQGVKAYAAAYSPNGRYIVSGDANGLVTLWDVINNTLVKNIKCHSGEIYGLNWDKESSKFISSASDGTTIIYDIFNKKIIGPFQSNAGWSNFADFNPKNCDEFVIGCGDGSLQIWSISQNKILYKIKGNSNLVHQVSYSPNGSMIASAGYDYKVNVWNSKDLTLITSLDKHKHAVYCAKWSHDGTKLASSAGVLDLTVKIWDTNNWTLIKDLIGHTNKINSCVWSPNDKFILSADDNDHIIKWDVNSGTLMKDFIAQSGGVYYADWSPFGGRFVSAGLNGNVKIWEKDTIKYVEDLSDSVWSIVPQSNFQNISGIINIYKAVTAFDYCENSVTVTNSDSLKIGDKVLLIQMQGALFDTTNTIKFGDITDIRSAGLYEFGFIKQILNNRIVFDKNIINKYNLDGNIQLVTDPIYKNIEVTNILTAQNWNGKTGGVLVFESDTIDLKADINVSGKGFRGGKIKSDYFPNNSKDFVFTSESDLSCSRKGEGIVVSTLDKNSGRGKIGNGGGGGNAHNAGGGGGGSYSNGGNGGKTFSGTGVFDYGGLGGLSLKNYDLSLKRYFLGGGGGAGQGNDKLATNGENGGGIIIVTSKVLINNNNSLIISNGINANEAGNDGAGGGGGGGNISILISNSDHKTIISALGGNGGDNNNGPPGYTYCHAPGGGGGGGIITVVASNPKNFTTNILGGKAGVITNKIAFCGYLSNYGATDGGYGLVDLSNTFTLVSQNKPIIPLSNSYLINKGKTNYYLCNTDSLDLVVEPFDKNLDYNWSNGYKGANINVKQTGNYSCTISNGLCYKILICNVNLIPKINFELNKVEFSAGCGLDSVKLTVNPFLNDFIYTWNPVNNGQSIMVTKTGKYKVYIRSKDANFNCIDSLETDILITKNSNSRNNLSFKDEDKINSMDTIYSNLTDCRNLKVYNNSSTDVLLDEFSFKINKNFSLPSSQFPILIKSNDSSNIVYCFNAVNSGIYRDTLLISDLCTSHKIKFVAYSLKPDGKGKNKCDISYDFVFSKILKEKNITFKSVFPNPTNNFINIDFEEVKGDTTSNLNYTFDYSIYSIIGSKVIENQIQIENKNNSIILDISFLSSGNYYLMIKHNESERMYWIVRE